MGYMSTNMFSTSEKGYARLMELICECGSAQWDAKCCNCKSSSRCSLLPKFDVEEHVEGGVVFGYEWWKWYACYFDMFHAAWERFKSEGYPWTHICIGEENGDVLEESSDTTCGPDEMGIPFLMLKVDWDYDTCC